MIAKRRGEIADLFLIKGDVCIEDLNKLNLEELAFLICFSKEYREEKTFKDIDIGSKIPIFIQSLRDKIKGGVDLYIAYEESTDYPFIDSENRGWIFSNNEHAVKTKNHCEKLSLMLNIKKIESTKIFDIFTDLHRLGIEKLMLDNGEYNVELSRSDILEPLDCNMDNSKSTPIINPKLQLSMLRFFQLLFSNNTSEAKLNILYKLQENMFAEIINAKYLVPIQLKGSELSIPDNEGDFILKKGTVMEVGILYGENGSKWLLAFTDWTEFEKIYSIDEWRGSVTSYSDLLVLSKEVDGIIINQGGISCCIDEKNRQLIEKFISNKCAAKKI